MKEEKYFVELIRFVKKEKPTKKQINNKKIELCSKYKIKKIPTNIEVLCNCKQKDMDFLKKYLQTKPTRTISGVAVLAVMTRPYPCPHGKCTYCPGGVDSEFGNVPQSYTGREPSTMRGMRNNYDAYRIIFNRLEQYIVLGQNPEKAEVIIMGGTFPSFPKDYQEETVTNIFKALNDFSKNFYKGSELNLKKFREFFELPGTVNDKNREERIMTRVLKLKIENKKSLKKEQEINEKAQVRCVGLTVETRPDYGLLEHGNELLEFGCTRIELGIQTTDDAILKRINRGYDEKTAIKSIKTLKDLGFKLNFHMMPGLPGSSNKKDVNIMKELFKNPDYQPDMLKIYPTMVLKGTKLYDEFKDKKYTPITTDEAAEIITKSKKYIPKYCRVMRVQRDIPTKMTIAGVDRTNLRQYIDKKLLENKQKCFCIRCREIKDREIKGKMKFEIIKYKASQGKEYFISLVDEKDYLLGFCRLRLPNQSLRPEITLKTGIIRELHIYGAATGLGKSGDVQHKGFGAKLLSKAEEIARKEKREKIVIISGVGVRSYYQKFGYKKEGPYMVKLL
ncbi:MAG: tRNA uridine(34) 5-carboxymethylaminomethyl modification radical SAM/GNAT enzyme Elp3 [Nanoarchaeota archaeon]|nr:tRNA uridine(34) 5-carboxymethylaminomethyl modification radical SAM/GNAT enzyme Elp3 [Nanoarchaeota archaeon]MBU1031037.1 tRNA uridine(34) 5-carboxymethylaminomethyl modification radical SAM/GNAT enzyme Elp3 [Nanoarchaeota archaeon]MBU1849635.1 tRNA uridine(34) 5-carboxymethylaminomethyl modification radical SAM/GNAT enzyme Elp3 [Nanoarchaeota archaeon]